MACSGKTPRLGLNQWALTDPFLMEDFNADNRKIEETLSPFSVVKLGEIVTTKVSYQIDLDLSGIEWDKYLQISIFWQLAFTRSGADDLICMACANNNRNNNYNPVRVLAAGQESVYTQWQYSAPMKVEPHGTKKFFETRMYPLFDQAPVMYYRDLSFSAADPTPVAAALLKDFQGTVLPLSGLKTLCFNYLHDDNTYSFLNFDPGSRFLIYGVKA